MMRQLFIVPCLFFALFSSASASATEATEQDCKLDILHSAIGATHTFNLKVSCDGNYNTLTYLLRVKNNKNGVTRTDSESGELHIRGDSQTAGEINLELDQGDSVSVEARILQACEVLGQATLAYTHQPRNPTE